MGLFCILRLEQLSLLGIIDCIVGAKVEGLRSLMDEALVAERVKAIEQDSIDPLRNARFMRHITLVR
jgi:hypothetical protein